ncbi:MAG: alpha-D-ribose 1-methylphosphonate 5-triphosphate diphosphatase [Pseudomonadota bacterium]
MSTITFTNGRVVLADTVIDGWVSIEDGRIQGVGPGQPSATLTRTHDLGGDMLIPGLVELHTDHMEQHLQPRPRVHWPERSAIMAFDAQVAASGITTVFDCVRAGNDADYAKQKGEITSVVHAVSEAMDAGLLRADHRIHLRCEVCADDVLSETKAVIENPHVGLISLMDHTPGARQFIDIEQWRTYYGGKSGLSNDQLDRLIKDKRAQFDRNYLQNRSAIVRLARQMNVKVASHDDATEAHVREALEDQVAIAEFPTTEEAARLSHAAGISVLMGAPNVVRGGSHSGNIAAEQLARLGYLDVLSSDYVPASLLLAAFILADRINDFDLPRALATVTSTPANAVGLHDRGTIAEGLRGDVVRVALVDSAPVVREVYREGQRVC